MNIVDYFLTFSAILNFTLVTLKVKVNTIHGLAN